MALDGGEPVVLDAAAAAAVAKVVELTRHGRRVVVTSEQDDLTTSQAATILGVSREWVARLIDAGELDGHRVGRHRRVSRRALEEYRRARPAGRRPTLSGLRRRRAAIRAAVAEQGGGDVRVFGSVARGEAHAGSDVDLFVDVPEGTGLMALAEMEATLSALLGCRVDVVPTAAAVRTPHLRDVLEQESVPL